MTLRRLIVSLFVVFFVALGVAAGLYFVDAREEYDRLRAIEAGNRLRLAETEGRLLEQEKILERLRSDPAYVEEVIRRKLHYVKPDEYIFLFEQ